MITIKLWKTETKKYGIILSRSFWKGYFLFGIIPVYVVNTKTEWYM